MKLHIIMVIEIVYNNLQFEIIFIYSQLKVLYNFN